MILPDTDDTTFSFQRSQRLIKQGLIPLFESDSPGDGRCLERFLFQHAEDRIR
jgi:hypothetical protein